MGVGSSESAVVEETTASRVRIRRSRVLVAIVVDVIRIGVGSVFKGKGRFMGRF